MFVFKHQLVFLAVLFCATGGSVYADGQWGSDDRGRGHGHHHKIEAQLGPRPAFLVDNLDDSKLKSKLRQCRNGPFYRSDFSIGHRGAPMQFPEHTKESYVAAARMGAGILECDVTFTKDRQLVCRHSQCDLHTTTNIVATDLAAKCSVPPMVNAVTGELLNGPDIQCCTSDITLAEFKTLKGKMDAANRNGKTIEEYLGGTAGWRTDLYAGTDKLNSLGTLLSHRESIRLFRKLGVKMTPELKSPSVPMPFQGDYTQEDYARQMIQEYRDEWVRGANVYPQSFNLDDVLLWVREIPHFGRQAVYLDGRYSDPDFLARLDDYGYLKQDMGRLRNEGVRIVAPPMWMLLTEENGEIVPSKYARAAKKMGLDIITWTLERSNLTDGGGDWYHQTTPVAVNKPGDKFKTLHALAKQVGVLGVFSDWPATTTYYANCMGLK